MMRASFVTAFWGLLLASIAWSQPREGRTELLRTLSVSELVGSPVTNDQWQHVATVEDVMMDPATGGVRFVVLHFSATNEAVALPWSGVAVSSLGRVHLRASASQIAAAPRWLAVSRRAPARGAPARATTTIARTATRTPVAPGRTYLQPRTPLGAYVSGIIVGTVTAPIDDTASRHVLVIVETDAGNVTVDLGAACHVEALSMDILPGETLRVAGSQKMTTEDHYVAREIMMGGRSVELPGPDARCAELVAAEDSLNDER